jgi:hypothetical protein
MVRQLSCSKWERIFKETAVAQFKAGVSIFWVKGHNRFEFFLSPAEHVKITVK